MGKLRQFRNKFPQYNDLSDEELAVLIHRKNYPDLPFESFAQDIGLRSKQQKLEKDLKEAKQTERERADRLVQLSERLRYAESELDKKNEQVVKILEKIKRADQSESVSIRKLEKELAKAKRDAHLAQQDLKRAGNQSHGDPGIKNLIKQLREKNRAYEQRMAKLESEARESKRRAEDYAEKLREERVNSNKGNAQSGEPKTWKECAETLGLSGNEFTLKDVTNAYKKRMREVHPDRVMTMDEDFKKMAEVKSKNVNSAYDYFKKYFKNK